MLINEAIKSIQFGVPSLSHCHKRALKMSCQDYPSKLSPSIQSVHALNDEDNELVDKLFLGLLSSDRASLARSITLIESSHVVKRAQAGALLLKALQHCKKTTEVNGPASASFRIGMSSD